MEKLRIKQAIFDILDLENEIKTMYELPSIELPDTLAAAGFGNPLDPWGNPYQYLKIAGGDKSGKGKWRKDKYLVPLNTTYDLYSMGKDGESSPPLTAKASWDDIIRANDGGYVGLGSEY
jgi:general secretion pathway protein G